MVTKDLDVCYELKIRICAAVPGFKNSIGAIQTRSYCLAIILFCYRRIRVWSICA